jgi:guanylate kinase
MWVAGWGQLKGQLVVVSGPSGSGKSTVLRRVLERAGLDLRLSVSATTRPRRPGERDGVDYHFLTPEEFLADRERGDFLEWAEYNGHSYGTRARPVYEALAAGRTVLLEIEVKGALQIRSSAPSSLFVFIRPPSFRALEERLRRRGTEDEGSTLRRLRKAREELAEAHWYDIPIVNDDLDRCVEELVDALRMNGCAPAPGG